VPRPARRPLEPDPVNTGGGTWILTAKDSENVQDQTAIGLSVRNLQLGWDGTTLIENLAFDARQGAWTCLLGESGVGKSTLLRTIAGLIEPLSDTQIVGENGKTVVGKTAYMAQQDLLLPWLTAADNVALGAHLRGERPDQARAREMLARTGITNRADARPGEMSGGERQRVALARTLMEERPIVLMDEPFSALDAITRTHLQNLAFELLGERTVLMVTHDPFEALRLGDQIHIIRAGNNQAGTPLSPSEKPLRDPTDPALRETYHEIMAALSSGNGKPGNRTRAT
jgi:putative hydroxymethylpyrimidine transport system ATP-binding protein